MITTYQDQAKSSITTFLVSQILDFTMVGASEDEYLVIFEDTEWTNQPKN